jgi:hypothetical protein
VTRRAAAWWVAGAALCVVAGLWRWHTPQVNKVGGVLVTGGDGGGLPRASPELEGFAVAALQAAGANTFAQGTSALLILRHGHLVFERYAHGADASTVVEGGEMARAVLIVAAGIAVAQHGMIMPGAPIDSGHLAEAISVASGKSYPAFLSRHVWQPLHAAPAFWTPGGLSARGVDWLRVGDLLLHDGRFEGTQVVQPGWVARHSTLLFGPAASLPSASGLLALRGPGSVRLWLAPRLDLVILCVAGAPPPGAAADDTVAHAIVNTLHDRPAAGGSSLNDLVPGH